MWLFMLPSVAVMLLVLFYPFASAVYYSFFDYYLGNSETHFVGLANYVGLLSEQRFWGDLSTTLIIVVDRSRCNWWSGSPWRSRCTR